MRKLFSAGVLITAATAAMFLPSAAQAESEDAQWTFVEDYFHLSDCRDAGEAGLRVGEWDAYDCEFEVVPGDWSLYALVDDEGEEEGGEEGGGEDEGSEEGGEDEGSEDGGDNGGDNGGDEEEEGDED